MKSSKRDQLSRLREMEAELDSKRAESNELRREIDEAIRAGLRWPPEPPSPERDSRSSS
jgi:hypothetical protein